MDFKAISITDYHFTISDHVLLDANIWIYIYGIQEPGSKLAAVYSQALANLLKAKSIIYIDVLILSEFINTYAKQKYKLLVKNPKSVSFKMFRKSKEFKPVAQEIALETSRVLRHCQRIESGFEFLPISDLLAEYEEGNSDFNDQVLSNLCETRELTLITHDADFYGQDICILTANKKLLM